MRETMRNPGLHRVIGSRAEVCGLEDFRPVLKRRAIIDPAAARNVIALRVLGDLVQVNGHILPMSLHAHIAETNGRRRRNLDVRQLEFHWIT